jgi:4,5-dihydroxyphthalate decarboxylase
VSTAVWRTLLGHHPVTRALRDGEVTSPRVALAFADVAVPNKAFKRVVRDLEFDVAELALMTLLMARSRGVPVRLLPVALFARNPLSYLVCAADARVGPRDLEGRTVGVRSFATTTAVWARALLAHAFGVDLDRIQWLTFEEAHVAGVAEPANVRRDAAHADLTALLDRGDADAILVDPIPKDARIVPVVEDADRVWREWMRDTGAQTINHVVVVRESLAADPEAVRELTRLFDESRQLARVPADALPPSGLDALRRSLERAIAAASAQRLLARPITVEELL